MKKMLLVLALLFGSSAFDSHAQTFFIGGEVGAALYPDFSSDVARSTVNAGASSATVKQDCCGAAVGVFGGVWINNNFGVEAAYTDLGNVEGKVTTVPASNTFYEYSASAASLAGLGGITLGSRGTLYGKLGAYKASVEFRSATRSITTDSSGLLIGGGYSHRFGKHLLGKAEIAVYNDVKFQTFNAPQGTTTSDAIVKIAVGAAYAF